MFIIKVFDKKHAEVVAKVVSRIRSVVQSYVSGLLIETSCVAVLNSIGLLLIGAPYAILLGIIGALLNLIPYIGGLIAVILTAIVTLSNTGNTTITLGSVGIYLAVQFIGNNFGAAYNWFKRAVKCIGFYIGGVNRQQPLRCRWHVFKPAFCCYLQSYFRQC